MGTTSSDEDALLRELARAPDIGANDMPNIAVSGGGVSVTARPPVLAVGQVLEGRFEVTAPIGKGGMGEVYRARDRQLGRNVAVKVLAIADDDRKRRFAQEARAASALQHVNILTVYDVGEHDGAPYLVLELLEGETLRERLTKGPLAPNVALELAIQIAAGLAAAHGAGIVHRDLKPENLLIACDPATRMDLIKILDFGLAKLMRERGPTSETSLTATGAILGTVSYMSPEQLRGEEVDHRSDLFAFGTILVEMLTGKAAFGRGSSAEIVSAILRDEVSLSALPAGFDRVIRRCLDKRPERRFQSTHDLVFALETLRGVPVRSRVPRRLAGYAIPAALIASAAAVALFAATREHEAPEPSVAPAPPAAARIPTMTRLTYRRGAIQAARFGPDGKTVYYSARWPYSAARIETTRAGIFESRMIDIGIGELLAVTRDGELAVQTGTDRRSVWQMWSVGKLSRASLGGGMPREALDSIAEADFAPDGSLAVAHVEGGAWRLEWPPGKVLVEAKSWIGQPRVSRDGTRLAYIDHPYPEDDTGAIVVIDRSGVSTTLAKDLLSVQGLAWSPTGNEVWFTGTRVGASRELRAVDLDGHERLLYRAPGALRLFDVSPTGEILVDRVDYRARTAIHRREQERDLSWLDGTAVNDCTNNKLLFSESFDGAGAQYGLYIRDLDGGAATRIGDGAGGTMSPDGRKVTLSRVSPDGQRDLYILPIGPGEEKLVARGHWIGMRWFPDGKHLLIVDITGATQIHDLETGTQTPAFTTRLANGFSLAISPDGTSVAFQQPDGSLAISELGGAVRRVPDALPYSIPLQFSPDGSRLIVAVNDDRTAHGTIYDLDVHGKRPKLMVRTVSPSDPAGVANYVGFCTPDLGQTLVTTHFQVLSTLYQMSNID